MTDPRPAPRRADRSRVERAVREMLGALGFDPSHESIADTPARVARAWGEQLAGYDLTAEEVLRTTFAAEGYDQVVVLRGIAFESTCEHHLLPFTGTADVAYVPYAKLGPTGATQPARVVGLSKLARLVDMHARRLQLQERLTKDLADDLDRVLEPAGVGVIVRASHSCMCLRGVRKTGAQMVTSEMRGLFRSSAEARAELFGLVGGVRP